MKIKICGLFRECDIDYVNLSKPDYIGFVFAKSRRQVTLEQAKQLKSKLNKEILAVGVFVNEEISTIKEIVSEKVIDIIQLHGNEDSFYITECKKLIPDIKIIKALQIDENITSNADFILYDAPIAGSGKTFDWSLLPSDGKYFLAGGINSDNINDAIALNPYCIDVSSGAEVDGIKDKNLIEQLVRRVHNEQ